MKRTKRMKSEESEESEESAGMKCRNEVKEGRREGGKEGRSE
jgi:hypothetical protein